MEHDLVALVGGVQGVGACRVGWRTEVMDLKSQRLQRLKTGGFSKSLRGFSYLSMAGLRFSFYSLSFIR